MRNDGLFYEKRRLVLGKTTACFMRNDGLFYEKRRLVLGKTTACFGKCNGRGRHGKVQIEKREIEM